jgi:hypothetical protein
MITTVAIIGDIVKSAGKLLADHASLIFPRHREDARKRVAKYLRSTERADALLQRLDWT